MGVPDDHFKHMNPQEVRDLPIECAGRLDGTLATVMESCPETYWKRYRLASAGVMADVVEHMRHLRGLDHDGTLTAAFEDFDEHLPKLMATLEDWEPRP